MPRTLLFVLLAAVLVLPGCSNSRKGCVSGSSLIDTPGGPVPAEEIRVGDLVTTRQADSSSGMGRVIATRHLMADNLLAVTLSDGRSLRVTPDHPIGVGESGFVAAGELIVGGAVRTGDADATVKVIEPVTGEHRVVDLTVEPDENFFANGVLVHNKSVVQRPPKPTMPGRYVNIASGATLELTETGGRLFIPRPQNAGELPAGDSVWDIGAWTLKDYTMTAPLTRRRAEDWLSRSIAPESAATLVIRAVGTQYPSTRPDAIPSETVIQSVRIETPSRQHGLGSAWTTKAAIERALRGFGPDDL
jgi:hypothetical protein